MTSRFLARLSAWLGDRLRDIRLGARSLQRTPGFSCTAILLLGLGVALTATTLTVVNAYLIRSLPYPAAERLYHVVYAPVGRPEPGGLAAMDWAPLHDIVELTDPSTFGRFYLTDQGYTDEAMGLLVAQGSLAALGIGAELGRSLEAEDFGSGAEPVALIGRAMWQSRFGSDPNVVGRLLPATPASQPGPTVWYRVVGVLPAEVRYARNYDRGEIEMVVPLRIPLQSYMVRLREGVPLAVAEQRINRAVNSAASSFPPDWAGVRLESVQDRYVAGLRPVLLALALAAGLVLLIVCANVAVRTLLRALRRHKELALRIALGAGPGYIIRMLAVEAGLLSAAALIVGLSLTTVSLRLLRPIIEERLGRAAPGGTSAISVDFTVMLLVGLVGLGTALSLSLIQLFTPWRSRLAETLRRVGRTGTEGRSMRRLRSSLVAMEVAGTLALAVGCGLMIRSVAHQVGTDLGFHPERVIRMRIALPSGAYPDSAAFLRFYDRLTDQLSAANVHFAFTNYPPLLEPPRQAVVADGNGDSLRVAVVAVGTDYFGTVGLGMAQGRNFSPADRPGTDPVAVISQALAHRLWPDGSALGRRIRTGDQPVAMPTVTAWRTIVGIAADARQTYTDVDLNDIYIPFLQATNRYASLHFQTDQPAELWLDRVRGLVARIDPQVLVTGPRSLRLDADRQLAGPRFLMSMLTGFALFAALIAALGIYGVTAYAVQQREREIAIRIAVGATPHAISTMFLRDAGVILALGIGGGLLGAVALARVLKNQLHGVGPLDVTTLCLASAFMATTGLLAVWWPSRRAAHVSPTVTLSEE